MVLAAALAAVVAAALLFAAPATAEWQLAVRTSTNGHQDMGDISSLVVGDPNGDQSGDFIFPPFVELVGVQAIRITRVDDGAQATFELVEQLAQSLLDTIMGCGITDSYEDVPSTTGAT